MQLLDKNPKLIKARKRIDEVTRKLGANRKANRKTDNPKKEKLEKAS